MAAIWAWGSWLVVVGGLVSVFAADHARWQAQICLAWLVARRTSVESRPLPRAASGVGSAERGCG